MSDLMINILPFHEDHQPGIDEMMSLIANEFVVSIFSPQSKTIKDVSLLPGNKYWVALFESKVIGTVGFSTIQNKCIVLKRLFVDKAFRGKGVSEALLETVINYATNNKISAIYLGTMNQFKAAQKFYTNHGFQEITQDELPIDFPIYPVDKLFYKKELRY
ncbi:N-acetylglutamate synthase, GNAT family [Spirosomataceae bacterium TFI 002]|nr:N-acetylglutamate synthase, GNAT family [Spirosomataceae bacterium TFI 002]